ncbi:MAG: signal peptide protein [Limisphaerales bacterium]|nr:MAG: signal peptide protein [Limisphaerales bacterium]KAG0510354.1 MAG: signal peptide protein [Limisphaerales bacterium]TXT51541.1 MAG: signal peptide protein [Limisphaerales bacterium]
MHRLNLAQTARLRSQRVREFGWRLVMAALVSAWPGTLGTEAAGAAADRQHQDLVRPFLERHCKECHSGAKPKGDWRLDQLTTDFTDKAARGRWEKVLEQLQTGEMPPKKQPRPPESEVRAVTGWIAAQVSQSVVAQRAAQGRVVLRRLNRTEYENTVRDLLGVQTPLKDLLPQDSSADGFDNIGEALHTSSFLLDKYLEAADTALNQAIANRPQPKSTRTRYLLTESHQVRSTTEKVFRKSEEGSLTLLSSSAWQQVGVTKFYPQERGRYRFTMSVSAVQSSNQPVVFRVWSGSGGMGGAKGHLVNYFDAPPGKPTILEFVDYMEPRTSISILPYGLASSQTVNKVGADAWEGPGLAIDWVEVEGPLNETWPPESHRRLFGDLKQDPAPIYNQRDRVDVISSEPLADADRILRQFARRAFRRSVTDADVKPFVALVEAKLAEQRTFEQAVRAALSAVLVSPEFLFLREQPGKLDDFALASRLSYFLWSTLPDEELLALAEQKKLTQPATLRAQVERLLNHPKARAFTENFTGQWLGLRDIDFTMPSHLHYPEFDDMLKVSMVRETELFFTEVLRHDLSLTNFVASDFTMLNGRLAKHYGIPGVSGFEFRRVKLPPDSHRGGVLTMASVLKVTANGTTTSPVLRGAWVLDRILGTPPPKPPDNVGTLEPDTRGTRNIREQLAKHRQLESCANCHVKMDPPGFALESFDVIGGWREFYRTSGNGKPVTIDGRRMPYLHGPRVDPSDMLADGRAFRDVDDLKRLLLTDKDQIARALTRKLLTYATGHGLEPADSPAVEAIVRQVKERNHGFRSLVAGVVASELFQSK